MSAAASRVITTSETGSCPAMRMSKRRAANVAPAVLGRIRIGAILRGLRRAAAYGPR
jgi:hypothetical protein